MEVTVLDKTLKRVKFLDVFDSLIWTDRYFKYGDFEIYTLANKEMITLLQEDYYLLMKDSEHVMVIESINLKTDVETGNKFIVTGRSLESILDRRIVWNQTLLSGSLQNAIKILLNENAIIPVDPNRKISNLIFETSTDVNVTNLSVDAQVMGVTLYEAISTLCEAQGIGFKLTINSAGQFVFKLYAGADRSYSQITNPFVAFSPSLENLTNTDYYHSKIPYKTVALVVGEGEGTARLSTTVESPFGSGLDLDRREKFTDARDISKTTSGGTISDEQYNTYLTERGLSSLIESLPVNAFDGKIDVLSGTYVYGEDYFIGDIVQIANEYGLTGRSRIEEMVFFEDSSGRDIYPTFVTV